MGVSQQFLFKTAVCIAYTQVLWSRQRLRSGVVVFWINTSEKVREWCFPFLGSFHSASNTWLMRVKHSGLHRHFPAQAHLLSAGPLHLTGLLLSNFPGLSILASSLALPGSFLLQALFRLPGYFFTYPGFSDPSLLGPCLSASPCYPSQTLVPSLYSRLWSNFPKKGHFDPSKCNNNRVGLKIISAY